MNGVLIRFNYNQSEISKANMSGRAPYYNRNSLKNGVRHKTIYSVETEDQGDNKKKKSTKLKMSSGYFLPHPYCQSDKQKQVFV